jgi:RNA polymerase sigma factor (sigma-70 family)
LNQNEADIVWWNAFKKGDREAFDNLFRRYYPILTQYGDRLFPNKSELDDTIQDLFIELWQSNSNTPVQSVKAYLFRSLKYKLFRHLKNQKGSETLVDIDSLYGFSLSHETFLVEKEKEAERTAKVLAAINRLPARQKEIVYLKIYQNMSYEEVSEVMNINYQVARNLFYQSIKSLRLLLTS